MRAYELRDEVIGMVRDRPERALRQAEEIADAWHRAQGLSWVARYAADELMAKRAFDGARAAAAKGKDAYQKAALLAWPIRAAVETQRGDLAKAMFDEALKVLQRIALFTSRADAIELIYAAAFPCGAGLRDRLVALLPELCPVTVHWRAARMHETIALVMATQDAAAAQAFVEGWPACKTRDRVLRRLARGQQQLPRSFYW
jgi:hypothetical protein